MTLQLGVRLPAGVTIGELLAEAGALEAAGAHLLWADDGEWDPITLLAAVAALTSRIRLGLAAPAPARDRELATLRLLSHGRLVVDGAEDWPAVTVPASPQAWQQLLAEHEAAGTPGLLVDHDPRLVDLLRHPAQVDDRQDLQLAQG